MKKLYLLSFLLFCISVNYAQSNLQRIYEYDASGNRTCSKVFVIKNLQTTVDSTDIENQDQFETAPYYTEQLGDIQLNIFPNPTTQMVTVQITNYVDFTEGTLKLYSLNGQSLRQYSITSSEIRIDLSDYAKGVYILKLQVNQQKDTWKIIKE